MKIDILKFKPLLLAFCILQSKIVAANNMPQLDFSKYSQQIFWLIVTFSLTYIFINKVVFPKITNIKQMRQTKILTNIEQTIKFKKEVDLINAKILEQKLNNNKTLTQLNIDLTEKIAVLKNKQTKELDDYKKQSNVNYIEKVNNYNKQNIMFNKDNLNLACNLIINKLQIKIDSNIILNKIDKVVGK